MRRLTDGEREVIREANDDAHECEAGWAREEREAMGEDAWAEEQYRREEWIWDQLHGESRAMDRIENGLHY